MVKVKLDDAYGVNLHNAIRDGWSALLEDIGKIDCATPASYPYAR